MVTLNVAVGHAVVGKVKFYEWYRRFQNGREYVEDYEHPSCPREVADDGRINWLMPCDSFGIFGHVTCSNNISLKVVEFRTKTTPRSHSGVDE